MNTVYHTRIKHSVCFGRRVSIVMKKKETEKYNIRTLDQIKDEYYGEIGTPERDRLESELETLRIGVKIRIGRKMSMQKK